MNEQSRQAARQALADQEYPPNQSERADLLLKSVADGIISKGQVAFLGDYIDLLRRQARRMFNQRRTLKSFHKVYEVTMMENRWLREAIRGDSQVGFRNWATIMERAKATLWKTFRFHQKERVPGASDQIDKLALFLLSIGEGPQDDEDPADTAIRIIKEFEIGK